ncbi:MAG: hypothetical protein M1821_003592 [Bathelium mastoideum]|nr:MAG: hypothetical protein M1821_003592 [Bathelium mastoideum]KAI9684880.1 MAG: hypothetical protein M1822_005529 [Bathelium mastoideum]
MMKEFEPLSDETTSVFADTTTLISGGPTRRFEPIRGTRDDDDVDLEHFTATGQPMPRYQHDHYTNVMGHGNSTNAGANLLPFRYTDASLITVPINITDLPVDDNDDTTSRSDSLPVPLPSTAVASKPVIKKTGFFRRLSAGGQVDKPKKEIKAVKMTRGDYLKFWAKDTKGMYKEDVVEPPGGRREWVRKQVELNEEWEREGLLPGRRR